MIVEEMRRMILTVYPKWKGVLKMPDKQVIAVYYALEEREMFKKQKEKEQKGQLHLRDFIKI